MARHARGESVIKIKKQVKNLGSGWIPLVIIGIIVIASASYLLRNANQSYPSADSVESIALKFIKSELIDPTVVTNVSVVNFSQMGSFYNMTLSLTVNGQTQAAAVYISEDGQYIFLQDPMKIKTAQSAPATAKNKSDTPIASVFVMSFCPYGQQAENGLYPVVNLLGSKINVELHYIVSKQGASYVSLHGDSEVNEDVRQLCIAETYNQQTLWNYINKVNSNCSLNDIETCWLTAAQSSGINSTAVQQCADTQKAALLDQEITATTSLGISSSPTIFINNQEYSGGRSADAFETAICSAFNTQPSECSVALNSAASGTNGNC
jgi:glutaredoxin